MGFQLKSHRCENWQFWALIWSHPCMFSEAMNTQQEITKQSVWIYKYNIQASYLRRFTEFSLRLTQDEKNPKWCEKWCLSVVSFIIILYLLSSHIPLNQQWMWALWTYLWVSRARRGEWEGSKVETEVGEVVGTQVRSPPPTTHPYPLPIS